MLFSNKLSTWYLQNKRVLPWRETKDPYAIWLSEIILQQTRVAQGLPYYETFLTEFPTVFDLARAPEDQVMRLWQGLGYYSRARNLHATAQKIAFEMGGIFPKNAKELQLLKGIGDYTAAAIASFAYKEVIPVVDGNVFRVLARVYGIELDISAPRTKKEFQRLAAELIPEKTPDIFNQAIMEFGALQCTPKSPNCSICPLQLNCVAFQTNQIEKLPVKLAKTKVRNRYFDFLIFIDPLHQTWVEQRTEKDIWQQLYAFPLIESKSSKLFSITQKLEENYQDLAVASIENCSPTPIIHKLSHQKLHIRFWKIHTSSPISSPFPIQDLDSIGFPIVIRNFIEEHLGIN